MSANRRGDIQGLRAVAVLAVIALHAVGAPLGGAAGVDVFFVISGFVITAALLREAERTGTVSLRLFYLRRARRIAPAAAVALAVVLVASVVLLRGAHRVAAVVDALCAAVGAGNLWTIVSGAARTHDVVPAGPFWSLAVEEQFYLAWPVLVLLAWRRGGRRRVLQAAVGTTVVSFGLAWWGGATDPADAYYSTAARGWELGAGCILAVLVPLLEGMARSKRLVVGFGALRRSRSAAWGGATTSSRCPEACCRWSGRSR